MNFTFNTSWKGSVGPQVCSAGVMRGCPDQEAWVSWRAEPHHTFTTEVDGEVLSAVENIMDRAQLWGAGVRIQPAALRNSSDWGVAWQLWRVWYEYLYRAPAPGATPLPPGPFGTQRYTSYILRPLFLETPEQREQFLLLARRKYDDPHQDMNWCRFLQLITSVEWDAGHAPYLGNLGGRYAITWLRYVGNAPRRDIVYGGVADPSRLPRQSTASWFSDMGLSPGRSGPLRPRRRYGATAPLPLDTLRVYQKAARLTRRTNHAYKGLFIDHVREFDLND